MSDPKLDAWTERADLYALGEGPAPGPAPDLGGALESEFFDGLAAMGRPIASEGDAALADALLDQFAATQAGTAASTAGAGLSRLELAAVAAALGGAVLAWFLIRPTPKPEAGPEAGAELPAVSMHDTTKAQVHDSRLDPPAPPVTSAPPAPSPGDAALPSPSIAEVPGIVAAPEPPQPHHAVKTVPSAAELLARARARKGNGDRKGAERAYRELLRRYPSSPEAHASHVSLGQLQLALGKTSSALEQFEGYAKAGGPLLEEAMWGRVQCLHRLGRSTRRDAAIAELHERFPASAYRARAVALQGDTP